MASTTTIYTGSGTDQLKALNTAWAQTTAVYYPKLFPKLGAGQSPQIFWFGCCDSRVPETTALGLLPGEVFVHRNIANLVHPDDISLPAALQYAVEHIHVLIIIVCGHLGCGGIAAACATTLVGVPEVDTWLGPLRALRSAHMNLLTGKASADEQAALVKLNVEHSVASISSNPTIAAAIGSGVLHVYGAIYDVGTGLISFLSGADVAEPATNGANSGFNSTYWYNITNSLIGSQAFVDIQSTSVQCNGPNGGYPNQHWKFTPTSDGAFLMIPQGTPNAVATINKTTYLVTVAPPIAGGDATQHFRPSTPNGFVSWEFTCDFLPSSFKLVVDPTTKNLKMGQDTGPGREFILSPLSKA